MYNVLSKGLIRSWRHNPGNQLTTMIALILTFTVLVSFINIYRNADSIINSWSDDIKLGVYLEDGASKVEIDDIRNFLKTIKNSKEVKYIPKEEAAKQFREKLSLIDNELFDEKSMGNPLPNAFEVFLKQEASLDNKFEILKVAAAKISQLSGVEEATYGKSWLDNYKALVKGFSSTVVGIVIILLIGSLMIIGNSIKSSISQRINEIEIYELLGATRADIQIPFIFEGAIHGLLSGIIAIVFASMISSWQLKIISSDLSFLSLNWSFLPTVEIFLFLIFATIVGMLGSYLCVKEINSGWSSVEKNIWTS
ncbi:MAG: ABC transporter permease [Bdellovibrionaceae bacterium]|jgi:cell division transport system permease protein|nr:ABC transporter permease [Pseudobdellovibrionaceae bacterium]